MKIFISLMVVFIVAAYGEGSRQPFHSPHKDPGAAKVGSVEVLDKSLSRLIDTSAAAEVIARGFEWAEGPVWSRELQSLLFSDVFSNAVYRWKEGAGISEYLRPAGYTGENKRGGELGSNGLMIDRQGRLVLCQHGDRSLARMEAPLNDPAPQFRRLAAQYHGKKLNSPNDLVQHSDGSIYFTDPPYGLEKQMKDPRKELKFQGVYRISPSGQLRLLTDELSRPNGIALSPDQRTLYVANSSPDRPIWMAYPVKDDGSLGRGRVFHDATEAARLEEGLPDGLTVDPEGFIYATGPGGVWFFNARGKVLGKLKTGSLTSNCAIGNSGPTLYVTADSLLLRFPLK